MVKLYLNPGHGGTDPGALKNGLKEKDLTLKIALEIRKILMQYSNIEIKMSREFDKTVSLKQATDEANAWGADFFLSIHINAGGGEGYEDFVYVSVNDASPTARIRDIIHAEIINKIDLKNRGKKKADFHVLRESKMPAMLTENGFIDNMSDSYKLKNSDYLAKIALGHANGIVRAFGLNKKVVKSPEKDDAIYRVIVGSFKDKENAAKRVEELKAKGFDSFVEIK